MRFLNRVQAGEKLAQSLAALAPLDPIVLVIPKGGAPVGSAVAKALACPIDVIPLQKIPVPWNPEASYGALATDGTMALNRPLLNRLEISESELKMATDSILQEALVREKRYRGDEPFPDLTGKTALITDDGLASGYSMLTAARFARSRNPRRVIVAAPVASREARDLLASEPGVDAVVALVTDPSPLISISSYYKDFVPLTDNEVIYYISEAA